MDIGATILGVALLGAFVFMLWGLVDAASQPRWAWETIGRRKYNWIAGYGVALLCCGLLTLFGTVDYLRSVRPQLLRVRRESAEAGGQVPAPGPARSDPQDTPPPGADPAGGERD